MGDVAAILRGIADPAGSSAAAGTTGGAGDELLFRQRSSKPSSRVGSGAVGATDVDGGKAKPKKKLNRELAAILGSNKEAEEMAPSMVRLRAVS